MQGGEPKDMEVDLVIGADGANSRVAREIDAGDYDYAIAFQERIKICDEDMEYYKDLAGAAPPPLPLSLPARQFLLIEQQNSRPICDLVGSGAVVDISALAAMK